MSPLQKSSPADVDEIVALEDEIAASAALMTAALGRWLGLVARFDACEGWARSGAVSCAEWLAWRCSLSPTTAREHVRVARRLGELPLIAGALRRGELSFSKARAVTRIEHIADEAEVLELARHATASQLERLVRLARRVTRTEAAAAIADRCLDVTFDDDGTAVVHGRLPAEDGALLLRALGHVDALLAAPEPTAVSSSESAGAGASDTAPPAPSAASRPPSPARRADALAWMADRALAAAAEPAEGPSAVGARLEVLVHVDAGLLSAPDADDAGPAAVHPSAASGEGRLRDIPRCDVGENAPIAAETARRLCCDAGLVPVVRDGDRTLAVGRRTRAIPPGIRRALQVRRPGCAFPGCPRTRWLDGHHVVHWARGGRTEIANLVHLCRHHHRLVHEGGWHLTLGDGGRCEVRAPNGRALVDAPRTPVDTRALRLASGALPSGAATTPLNAGTSPSDAATAPPGAATAPLNAATALTPLSLGERYDLGLAVDALVAWTQPHADAPADEDDAHREDARAA